jgi:hypothetical protein
VGSRVVSTIRTEWVSKQALLDSWKVSTTVDPDPDPDPDPVQIWL